MAGLKGKARQWFGWIVIIASDIAFASVSLYETKRLFVSGAEQQPLVDIIMIIADAGLAITLVVLAALMIWRLVDLFRRNGRWTKESGAKRPGGAPTRRYMKRQTHGQLVATCDRRQIIAHHPSPAGLNLLNQVAAPVVTAALAIVETEVDAAAWAKVPAGEFVLGQHEERAWLTSPTKYASPTRPMPNSGRYLNEALTQARSSPGRSDRRLLPRRSVPRP